MVQLHFVTETGKRGKRGRAARIHTAKINRQRQWQAKSQNENSKSSRSIESVRESVEIKAEECQYDTEVLTMTGETSSDTDDLESVDSWGQMSSADAVSPTHSNTEYSISRSVSPVFGGLTNSFGEKHSSQAATLVQYWLEVPMGTTLQCPEKPAWVQEFCQQPIVYHCLVYVAYVYQEKCHNIQISEQVLLKHKVELIRLVNDALTQLQDDDHSLQPLILGIATLWKIPRSEAVVYDFGLFRPQIPDANIIHASPTGDWNDPHAKSLLYLIGRLGGLDHIDRFPKLGPTLTVADCLASSAHLTRPVLSSYWRANHYLATARTLLQMPPHSTSSGFDLIVPGGLPSAARSVYNWLRDIDHFIETQHHHHHHHHHPMSKSTSIVLSNARTAIQHDLLSLPPWKELKLAGGAEGSYNAVYDLCKTTATLYSCCVLFPLHKRAGWLPRLLAQMLDILEWSNLAVWNVEGVVPLLVWCYFVAALAAYEEDAVLRQGFLDRLREILVVNRLTRWARVEAILLRFLWTNSSCGHGAVVVWEALGFDEDGV